MGHLDEKEDKKIGASGHPTWAFLRGKEKKWRPEGRRSSRKPGGEVTAGMRRRKPADPLSAVVHLVPPRIEKADRHAV